MTNSIEKYPTYTQSILKEHRLENRVDEINWHQLGKSMDEKLQEVFQTFQDLTSANIPAIQAAKDRVNTQFIQYGNQIHVFAKEEARHQLHLSNEDVTKLFAQVEIGGARLTPAPN